MALPSRREAGLAAGVLDGTDQAVLETLRTALNHVDPVPHELVERITFAVALDEVRAEVAEITRTPAAMVGARSTGTAQQSMTFSAGGTTVVVVVAPQAPGAVRLDGWVTPDTVSRVVLRVPDDQREASVEDGRFSFDAIPGGMVQLVVHRPGASGPLVTPTLDV